MNQLIPEFIQATAARTPDATALLWKREQLDYRTLANQVDAAARGLRRLGLEAGERVAVYLSKRFETVIGLFGAAAAGGVFVPVNPILKPEQVAHILNDCDVRVLISSKDRFEVMRPLFDQLPDLRHLIDISGDCAPQGLPDHLAWSAWANLMDTGSDAPAPHPRIDHDIAAILYTSGSTGRPKGVVLSHRNMVAGAHSVATYLDNTADDRLLAVLPLSFDYGLSQLTTAFLVGASAVLMDYLLPRDVIRAVARHQATGLAAVPPLWNQLAGLDWPEEAVNSLRYITNSGGAMPRKTLDALRTALPRTKPFLMYGLTEAFRSTYLDPSEVGARPDSMGKAIPNAEVLVVREDGSICDDDEPGELVHRGALVSLGYWNDPDKTALRFKPAPGVPSELPNPELAVWSGDQVRRDAEGYLYFVGRKDEMIKTSGYRVSPTEVEESVFRFPGVDQAAAFGVPHETLGQTIALIVKPASELDPQALLSHLKQELPAFMVPTHIDLREDLPRNANGKIDRNRLSSDFQA